MTEATTTTTPPDERRRVEGRLEERLELVVAILLGLAALATAWAAYQSSQWDGEEVRAYTDANLKLADSNFFYNQGTQLAGQDEAIFLEYVTAIQQEDTDLALYIRETLMRDELLAAIEWWETQPDDGPVTPFVEENPDWTNASYAEADALAAEVEAVYARGQDANVAGDAYNLVAVLLAASLFVLGITGSFKVVTMRLLAIGVGAVLFIGASLWMLTLPVAG